MICLGHFSFPTGICKSQQPANELSGKCGKASEEQQVEEKKCAARAGGEEKRNKNESYSFMVNFLIM